MLYFKALTQLNSPATAKQVYDKAQEIAPHKTRDLQTVRAALAYLVRTHRAVRVGHGQYEAIQTNENEVIKLVAENQRLRERLRTLAKAFMVIIEANGYQLKDFEG